MAPDSGTWSTSSTWLCRDRDSDPGSWSKAAWDAHQENRAWEDDSNAETSRAWAGCQPRSGEEQGVLGEVGVSQRQIHKLVLRAAFRILIFMQVRQLLHSAARINISEHTVSGEYARAPRLAIFQFSCLSESWKTTRTDDSLSLRLKTYPLSEVEKA